MKTLNILNRPLLTDELQFSENMNIKRNYSNRPLSTDEIRQMPSGEFGATQFLNHFVFSQNNTLTVIRRRQCDWTANKKSVKN